MWAIKFNMVLAVLFDILHGYLHMYVLCILDITATDTIKKNRNGYMGINEEKFCEA